MDLNDLRNDYPKFIEREKFAAEKCATEEMRKFYIDSIEMTRSHLAICATYVDHDFVLARQHFSYSAIAREYADKKYGHTIFMTMQNCCYAVLSDNSRAIGHFNDLVSHNERTLPEGFGRGVQAVLKKDAAGLQDAIEILTKTTKKKGWQGQFAGTTVVFTGLSQNDKAMVEKGLEALLAAHKNQTQPVVLRDFFNIEATTLAKLAWMQGLEVNIDSPLLPKELLPVQECLEYPGFDFFSEIGY
jgi:hypothetical protein